MSLTITIPGAVVATTGATAPATLTIGVGTPGATGPQGPAGAGVPAGGTAGQFLTKIDGTNYNTDWTTVNLSAYAVKANNLSDLASASTARSNLGLGTMATATASDYSTTVVNNGLYYPLTGNPSAFLTSASLSGYLTSATAAATYAPIAAGLPTGGTVGQVLTKNSGTDYDDSWQTLIPGDRYLTTSTTSNTISNGAKTFTVGTGLSYSSQQDVVISYDAANHMHALVTSYNSGTGVLVVDVQNHTGSGTYASWTVNVGGTTPLQAVEWGEILGVLGDQGDLATALNSKLETSTAASTYAALAGATFTGEVVTPASTTVSAGLTITPGVAPTTPTNGEIWATTTDLQVRLNGVTETIAEQSWVTAQGYLTSAPVTSVAGKTGAVSLVVGDVSGAADLAGSTFTGKVNTVASTTTTAGLNIPHGVAPTSPVNGDIWTTTGNVLVRLNGGTQTLAMLGGNNVFTNQNNTFGNSTSAGTINLGTGATISGATKAINIGTNGVSGSTTNITLGSAVAGALGTTTVNNLLSTVASTTTTAGLRVPHGTAPTTPVNGDIWTTTAAIFVRINGSSNWLVDGTTTQDIGASKTFSNANVSFGTSAGTGTVNVGTGATISGSTKTVNIGTGGVAGSTTNIAIGSTTGTSTTTLQGITNGVTQSAGDSSLKLATTAFVTTADNLKANLASPSFTGTPLAPTATAGTNTTQIATTAFVTAAVPSFATTAEIASPSSTTKVVAPNDVVRMIVNRASFDTQNSSPTFATSGTGATAYKMTNDRSMQIGTPNAGIAGYGQMIYDTTAGAWGVLGAKRGDNFFTQDWNKRIWMSGTHMFTSIGDANTTAYCMLGGRSSITTGNPTKQAIGWKLVGGGTALKLVTYGYNGTGLVVTETTSSFTPVANQSFDWMIVHAPNVANPATSYCYLYVNDALVATGIYSPADATINYNYFYHSFESTASMATRLDAIVFPVKVWWSKS